MAYLYQETYGVEAQIQRMGSLEDLYRTMKSVYKEQPGNIFAWMGMFYQYYMTNGSTSLGKLDNDRYPEVAPISVETFLKAHTKENIAKSGQF